MGKAAQLLSEHIARISFPLRNVPMMRYLIPVLSVIPGLFASGPVVAAEFDLVIRGGRIVDGTGNPWFAADIAIRGDRIVSAGRVAGQAKREADASGMIVAPGFIDIHSHSNFLLHLEDAVRKMTSLNAAKVGLTDRRLLRPGQYADITVFDPTTVIDRSTCSEPFQYSTGIRHVLVNGQLVLHDGRHTGAMPGRTLRKTRELEHAAERRESGAAAREAVPR